MESKKNKKISWLCTHPPGAKCVNCLRIPKKGVKRACAHPPHMKCPNCMEGADAKEDPKDAPKGRCLHGPNAACANCLPAEEDDDEATFRCRNHGPHGSCVECIERREARKMKLKRQPQAHCTSANVDFTAATVFQNYLHLKKFKVNRCGLLYGRFNDDGGVSVDVIYEPPQQSTKEASVMLQDKDMDRVEQIASMLGLRRVGWIFSHPPRSKGIIMTPSEIATAAYLQNTYGNQAVTLILSVNEKGEGNLEAFQVSDQAMKLQSKGSFVASVGVPMTGQTAPTGAESGSAGSGTKAMLREAVFVEGAETREADTSFFIVTVPVKSAGEKGGILGADFPVENRDPAQASSDVKVHMMHMAGKPFLQQLSDFHLVLYLSKNYFDMATDIPAMCEAVRTKSQGALEGYKVIMESLASM
eukprot:TRINITY_DN18347_c0_g1_i1.p1 TRINITY_DN18347_c0_g1~~TRINITY_DN18347_c0_g1_i1.p1  ORF type:complete len:416 (+),score=129.08 TRINITY_DN18347_c0_g1_i1:571-1818(+)